VIRPSPRTISLTLTHQLATHPAVREPINAWWLVCYSQPRSWLRVWHSVPPVCRMQCLVIQSPAVIASRALTVEPWYDDMLHPTNMAVMFSTVSDVSIPPVILTQSAPDKSPYLSNVFGAFWTTSPVSNSPLIQLLPYFLQYKRESREKHTRDDPPIHIFG